MTQAEIAGSGRGDGRPGHTFVDEETSAPLSLATLVGLAVVVAVVASAVGPVRVGLGEMLGLVTGALSGAWSEPLSTGQSVLMHIRLPRVLLGVMCGATLSVAGAVMQGIFRNPLADPGLIGVSAGGALGAVSVIVLGGGAASYWVSATGQFALPLAAFLGAVTATLLIYRLSQVDGQVVVATMLLAGVALNALAMALIGYLTFLSDEQQLRMLTFWTLGSLGGANWQEVVPALLVMLVATVCLFRLARPLNALTLGESDAIHLGVNLRVVKRRAALFTALGVGAAVSMTGIVGFVGLVTPHIVRLTLGPDHRYLLPASAALGAGLLVLADLAARMLVMPAELPLGVVTAILGSPFFLWLLLRQRGQALAGSA